ncbi:flagellar assembly protein FliH [Nitrogeniibacter mangrovi]|uniref:Flagellar assembly protein FliH n=1 Tax=Nitrogeniibacter mangrovi TaxID=2016596 RepID=A0A6C1B2P7_9RHOO|nr:flagellar assembly protein FliH [Nitrogeniibacter mangrovi]QID17259.1 flagellar assembly protein FliH [Nitrogeniibacter mangrovi]
MSFHRNQAAGAYRRWDPPSFDAPPEPEPAPVELDSPEPPPEPETFEPEADAEPPFKLPTAEDIERIHDEARKEGYAAGYEEATARGRMEALQLHTLVENLDAAMTQLDQDVAEEVLALSLEVARQMVQHSMHEHPAMVVDVVREALHHLPQGRALIHLNPEDASLVREYLGEQLKHNEHRLVEDDTVARGGCRVEAAGSMVDATVQTRWRRIMENLGRDDTEWEAQD